MPMWVWIAIGVGSFLVLSLLVGLALARILGTIARKTSELYENEVWSTLPPTRMSEDVTQTERDKTEPEQSSVDRRTGQSAW
jgi:hypothetical protein